MNDRPKTSPVHRFIVNHDDSKVFIVSYISLAVVLSIALGLFWLCVVVGLHYLLELIRQYSRGNSFSHILFYSFWEVKLDVFLVLFAFLISIYIEVLFGIAGLSAGTRAAATAGARFAAWNRVIRAILISVDDVALVLRAVGRRYAIRSAGDKQETVPEGGAILEDRSAGHGSVEPSEQVRFISTGDIFSLLFGAVCIILIFIAPFLTDHSLGDVWGIIIDELRPFPS